MSTYLIDSDADNFDRDVFSETDVVVIVVFWMPGIDLARAILRFVHQSAVTFNLRLRFVRVDARYHPGIISTYQVGKLPTFLIIKQGVVVDQVMTLDPMVLVNCLRPALQQVS